MTPIPEFEEFEKEFDYKCSMAYDIDGRKKEDEFKELVNYIFLHFIPKSTLEKFIKEGNEKINFGKNPNKDMPYNLMIKGYSQCISDLSKLL